MNEREKNILEAALRVFNRHGVKRTSMGDIADEAGISRQTLYKAFRSKDDVLRTHIRVYTDQAIREIEAGLEQTEGLGPQLDLILNRMTVVGFDMVRASPNARDIEEGINENSKQELEITAGRFQTVIAGVLSPYAAALESTGMSPETLAEFIQRSARAAKGYAVDRKHLLQQLNTLKQLCLESAKAR